MYRCNFYRGGPVLTSAMSGIEQALWDVKGKALGVPVYELLGGAVRDKLRMYAWIMAEGDADYLAETQQRIDQGYDTIKMCVTDEMGWVDNVRKVHAAAEKVARIRDRFGYDIDIAVDFHGRVHMPMARMLMKELEPFGLLYIEEPLQPEQIEGFRELRNHTSTPIATGERMYTRWGFKNLIASGAIDIVQPMSATRAAFWNPAKLPLWPSVTTWESRRTVPWVLSHWPLAFNWISARLTPSFRNRA